MNFDKCYLQIKLSASIILATFSLLLSAGQADVTGFGVIEQNNIAKARQAALDSAKQLAVEQLLGTYISARTETKNFMLASEKIYATTRGRIDKFDILDEQKLDENTYQVKIRAYIDSSTAATDALRLLKQNNWAKKPRIMLEVESSEPSSASAQATAAIKANISEALGKQGFIVLDNESSIVASFYLKLAVSGNAMQSDVQGLSIVTNQVSVSGGVYNSVTNSQIGSMSFSDKKAGDSGAAFRKIGKSLGQRVVQKVNMETRFVWLTAIENPVLIKVNGASTSQLNALQNNLQQAVVGLSGLTTERKTQQDYLFSASYMGWPEQLFEQLNQLSERSDITFNVVGFDQSMLTLSIK